MPDPPPDERHLAGLLGSVGKSIAHHPQGRTVVARLRDAEGPEELGAVLRDLDLGLAPPARDLVTRAAMDPERWNRVHATLVRAAEQSLEDRFHSSA